MTVQAATQTAMQQQRVSWPADVSKSLLSRIFAYVRLDPKRKSLPLVCKAWNNVLKTPGPHWTEWDIRILFGWSEDLMDEDRPCAIKLSWTLQRVQLAVVRSTIVLVTTDVVSGATMMMVNSLRPASRFNVSHLTRLHLKELPFLAGFQKLTQLVDLRLSYVHFLEQNATKDGGLMMLSGFSKLQRLTLHRCIFGLMHGPPGSTTPSRRSIGLGYGVGTYKPCPKALTAALSCITTLNELTFHVHNTDYEGGPWLGFDGLTSLTRLEWETEWPPVDPDEEGYDDEDDDATPWFDNHVAAVRSLAALTRLQHLKIDLPVRHLHDPLPPHLISQSSRAFNDAFELLTALTSLEFDVEGAGCFMRKPLFIAPPAVFARPRLQRVTAHHMTFNAAAFLPVYSENVETSNTVALQSNVIGGPQFVSIWNCGFARSAYNLRDYSVFFRNLKDLQLGSNAAAKWFVAVTSSMTSSSATPSPMTSSVTSAMTSSVTSSMTPLQCTVAALRKLCFKLSTVENFTAANAAYVSKLAPVTQLVMDVHTRWTSKDFVRPSAAARACCQHYIATLQQIKTLVNLRHLELHIPCVYMDAPPVKSKRQTAFAAYAVTIANILQHCTQLLRLKVELYYFPYMCPNPPKHVVDDKELMDVTATNRKQFLSMVSQCFPFDVKKIDRRVMPCFVA